MAAAKAEDADRGQHADSKDGKEVAHYSSTSSMCRLPASSSSLRVSVSEYFGSSHSITRKNLSCVDLGEAPVLEQRMMQARQPVQEQHAQHRAKRAQQNRQLEAGHEGVERAEHRFAADDDRVVVGVHVPDHQHAAGVAGGAAEEGEPAHLRIPHAHRAVHAVHRERA